MTGRKNHWDAIIVGAGLGGLFKAVTSTRPAARSAAAIAAAFPADTVRCQGAFAAFSATAGHDAAVARAP